MVMHQNNSLENYFAPFRKNIIGCGQTFQSPFGEKKIIYADWTASGRAYRPIEEILQAEVLPFAGNTHTGTSITGSRMSAAYEMARTIIKQHVNAGSDDALIFCGSGMTAAVNKLQRIMGLRVPERVREYTKSSVQSNFSAAKETANNVKRKLNEYLRIDEALRPVVFVTHMEHHSNHTSWLETIADVEIIQPSANGNVDLTHLKDLLDKYAKRPNKIAAVTACSNVTGIQTPYYEIARLLHQHNGLCFVDFACSAPYVPINMHPGGEGTQLDAIYFSMHKFLGGPGTPGVLVFNKSLYNNTIPDQPGGGTVVYTNPWGFSEYVLDIEQREDGGTPPFLQAIKAAMCIRLKEQMGIENIAQREEEMTKRMFSRLSKMKHVVVLEEQARKRLEIISFVIPGAHHNLVVKLLNDRFGIQARGGCSCAGTYGHYLLDVDQDRSLQILNHIREGRLSHKPGWVRLSVHPVMTNAEIDFIMDAVYAISLHFKQWMTGYNYNSLSNEYEYAAKNCNDHDVVKGWFNISAHTYTNQCLQPV